MALVFTGQLDVADKKFRQLLDVKPGFNPTNVLTMDVQLPDLAPSKYENRDEQAAFFEQLTVESNHCPASKRCCSGDASLNRRL